MTLNHQYMASLLHSTMYKGSRTSLTSLALVRLLFKEVQNIFQLNKNQIKSMIKNRAGIERLGYEPWNTSKVRRLSELRRVKPSFETL